MSWLSLVRGAEEHRARWNNGHWRMAGSSSEKEPSTCFRPLSLRSRILRGRAGAMLRAPTGHLGHRAWENRPPSILSHIDDRIYGISGIPGLRGSEGREEGTVVGEASQTFSSRSRWW